MCMITGNSNQYHRSECTVHRQQQSKRPSIRVYRLHKKRLSKQAKEKAKVGVLRTKMEMENVKLYMENQRMMKENDRLRKKALLLHQENRALLSKLQRLSFDHIKQ